MIIDVFWAVVPILAALWSLFIAKTGRLIPLPGRKKKPQGIGKGYHWPYREVKCHNGTGATISNELAIPEEPLPVYELYDHPAPPIPLLGASLPTAPIGYGWEIHVVKNDEGNPALRLAMLDLATSTVIDAIEGDLVILRRWKYANDDTYAAFYRRAEAQVKTEITGYELHGRKKVPIYSNDPSKLLGKVMMANLVTPMVDWARLITLRYIVDHPDETKCNYMLIENMEEASA